METINEKDTLAYKVGGLLYTPALNTKIADKIIQKKYDCLTSIAFCLEDSIKDEALPMAEIELCNTLSKLKNSNSDLPLLFVRVRTPEHMKKIHNMIQEQEDIITGYILPKFDLTNCDEYSALITEYNEGLENKLYIMPILESSMVADIGGRVPALYELKEKLLHIKDLVLNIRVGGNDFSNMYGLRRNINQNIYEIGVIRDILVNIINVFGTDFVVSGPVWEYFGSDVDEEWKHGLIRELELDKLNGFIGKTAIHPSQIPVIYDSLKVSKADYEDAIKILGWDLDEYGVGKSSNGSRMNEVKCHLRWADRIYKLGQVYGIQEG